MRARFSYLTIYFSFFFFQKMPSLVKRQAPMPTQPKVEETQTQAILTSVVSNVSTTIAPIKNVEETGGSGELDCRITHRQNFSYPSISLWHSKKKRIHKKFYNSCFEKGRSLFFTLPSLVISMNTKLNLLTASARVVFNISESRESLKNCGIFLYFVYSCLLENL